jgi:hypothetical protein
MADQEPLGFTCSKCGQPFLSDPRFRASSVPQIQLTAKVDSEAVERTRATLWPCWGPTRPSNRPRWGSRRSSMRCPNMEPLK